jgi:hypothetical protein
MLTAMVAVDNIVEGSSEKANIWKVNAEQEYHEAQKQQAITPAATGTAIPAGPSTQHPEPTVSPCPSCEGIPDAVPVGETD